MARKFKDADQIAPALRPYVAAAVQAGLIHGDKGKFAPNRVLTRAEVATLLKSIENLNLEVVVPSDNSAETSTTPSVPTTTGSASSTEVTPSAPATSGGTSSTAVTSTTSATSGDTSVSQAVYGN